MSINEIVQIVSSFFVAIGLVLSVLLWRTTVRSLDEIRKQNENIARSIRTDAIYKITESHRNLFLELLNNPTLASALTKGMESPKTPFVEQMVGTLLINHCAAVHLYATQRTLDPDDWLGMQNDIADLFSWPVVRERWPQIRAFYSGDFQDFIDTVVTKGRRVTDNSQS